jgi:hypothetical protein
MTTPTIMCNVYLPGGVMRLSTVKGKGDRFRTLNESPFNQPGSAQASYWVARITPPPQDQGEDAYSVMGVRRKLNRMYLQPNSGAPRFQIGLDKLDAGKAYEFGGDMVGRDARTMRRIYATFLGMDQDGVVAMFRVWESAEKAMEEEERRLNRVAPRPPQDAATTAPTGPAKSTRPPLPPTHLDNLTARYWSAITDLMVVGEMRKNIEALGYDASITVTDEGRTEKARDKAREIAARAMRLYPWVGLMRVSEVAPPVSTPIPTPAHAPTPVQGNLLDAIAREADMVVAESAPDGFDDSQDTDPADAADTGKGKPPSSFPRPTYLPRPTGKCPF